MEFREKAEELFNKADYDGLLELVKEEIEENPKEALEYCNKVIERKPNDKEAYFIKFDYLVNDSEIKTWEGGEEQLKEEILSTFHRLIKLEEDTSEVFEYYSDLIDFYEGRLQDIEAAAKIYKEANELADKFPNVEAALDIRFGYFSYLTISCKFNENDGSKEKLKEEVLKVFYKMIELESDKEEICEEYDSLGDFYIEKMNDYEAAIGVYEEALGKYKFKEDDQEWLQDKLETAKERARSKNKVNIVINPFVLSTIVIIAIIFAICCKFIK